MEGEDRGTKTTSSEHEINIRDSSMAPDGSTRAQISINFMHRKFPAGSGTGDGAREAETETTKLSDGSSRHDDASELADKQVQVLPDHRINELGVFTKKNEVLGEEGWGDCCCIYRVPKWLRDFDNVAYTPEVVSIGPFHSATSNLQAMEKQKMRYVRKFSTSGRFDCGFFEICKRLVSDHEDRIRHHYAETFEMTSNEFVELIAFDAIFIIGFMLTDEAARDEAPCISLAIRKDMILLENQIPFFILDLLFKLVCPCNQRSFIQISFEFFKCLFLVEEGSLKYPNENIEVKHFVDLLRLCHLPSSTRVVRRSDSNYAAPTRFKANSATKLKRAGMKFKKSSSTQGLLDIKYDGITKTLEIPPFAVSYYTSFVLRNMVALEQFHYGKEATYITDYVIFMDALIDTAEDATLLIDKKIIQNFRGDSCSVSKVFNNFTDGVTFYLDCYYYNVITQKLNKYCEDAWNTWWAILKRDHLGTPWVVASTVAACLLLLCTFIQTAFSFISFFTSK